MRAVRFGVKADMAAQSHRLTLCMYLSKASPNCLRILASSNGMCTQFSMAKIAIGARNIGHAPAQKALPNVTRTKPRYMGLRVIRKGPDVTSLLFDVEVGFNSVSSRRNSSTAEAADVIPSTISTIASGICGGAQLGSTEEPSNRAWIGRRLHGGLRRKPCLL